ncbi:Na+/melibiose symporter-like transporter [Streptacidiphilus sp. MAP12-16]|uniref:hypothetical protein n=1 Tax=Streptacidiphilus sp. MAP12-16 TaxID=3156300 RepID=UPI00351153A3
MSGAAVMGLVTAGAMLVVLGWSALVWRRDSERLRLLRADRWAKEVDLALPPDLVEPLAARVRQQTLVQFALMALLGIPVFALSTWRFFASSLPSRSLLHGPAFALLCMAVTIVMSALGQLWGLRREQRAPGERVVRPWPIALRMAIPESALWAARVLAVAPALLAVAVLWEVRRQGVAHEFSPYVFGAALLPRCCSCAGWRVDSWPS